MEMRPLCRDVQGVASPVRRGGHCGILRCSATLLPPSCPTPSPVAAPRVPAEDKRTLFDRLVEFISPGPDSRDELIATLADAEQRELIEPESRQMLEGVLRMADMSAGDVMVAAPRMDLLDIDAPYDELLARGDRDRRTRAFRSTTAGATTSSAS